MCNERESSHGRLKIPFGDAIVLTRPLGTQVISDLLPELDASRIDALYKGLRDQGIYMLATSNSDAGQPTIKSDRTTGQPVPLAL
jgi:hypothetical protein